MSKQFRSLSDLAQLLPEHERAKALERPEPKKGPDGKGRSVRVTLDSSGRKGKTVTLVTGLQHDPQTIENIAKQLKQYCGAGGTVKDGVIEVQGDQMEKVKEKLRSMDYAVK